MLRDHVEVNDARCGSALSRVTGLCSHIPDSAITRALGMPTFVSVSLDWGQDCWLAGAKIKLGETFCSFVLRLKEEIKMQFYLNIRASVPYSASFLIKIFYISIL